MARYAVRVNRLDCVALTLLDVLDDFETVRVATGYRLRGETLDGLPLASWELADVEPVYTDFPGWKQDTTGARSLGDLPPKARCFLDGMAEILGCSIGLVSVGPARDQYLVPDDSPLRRWFPKI
jgi:adenylosuccinate synthase